ncbi:ArsR/SmtB family transcription factor [Methylobacterium dankookense]|uniref:Transcriptional repressor SdpR n=1 Tax=Methylobacterium dankookense TaxID=560405 RepID=A0A564FZ88_9HYPH|nr:metalloregulator ArsR/SmtB family transcription factor [Methylobacterium dankookense]GJD56540.1 hypothetical protein IFDJLNFL_2437 [Methylobacterium dankookense]VUF12701.1 Transcriptional repressor SdpR [Methylobacterium dankookense]
MVQQKDARLDSLFHALSDRTRRAILHSLSERDRSISELAEPFDMSFRAVSKHVKVLEEAGLVRRSIRGRTHLCGLEAGRLRDARDWLDAYGTFWHERLDALDDLIGETPETADV